MILLQMETNAVQKIRQCTGIKIVAVVLSHRIKAGLALSDIIRSVPGENLSRIFKDLTRSS